MIEETGWLSYFAEVIAIAVVGVGLSQNLMYFVQLALAIFAMKPERANIDDNSLWLRYSDNCPPMSMLSPAYNEEMGIVESTKALLALKYPKLEVIVINDGSTDSTLECLIKAFELKPSYRIFQEVIPHKPIRGIYRSASYPNLVVVDKENGGSKADAMNAGINVSRSPLFCAMDSDSIIESDALLRIVQPFVDQPGRTVAVGGSVRVVNSCRVSSGRVVEVRTPKSLVALFQVLEYMRAYAVGRVAWSELKTLTLISGAFGVFRRDVVVNVGGYATDTVGEDLELVLKMHAYLLERKVKYNIVFLPEPLCWTEVPETLAVLKRQRTRWQMGALEVFFKHRRMFLNPRYGRIGMLGMGHIFLADVIGPLAEMLGYILIPFFWWTGVLNIEYMWALLALVFLAGTFFSMGSMLLAELDIRRYPRIKDLLRLALAALIENLGYRQLNGLWRLRGWWKFLRKDSVWEPMPRVGFKRD